MNETASASLVFVVEDDVHVAQGLRSALSAASGWQVTEVSCSVAEARERLGQGLAFDVALVDLGLPDGSGTEVMEQVARLHPERAIVAFTQFDDPDNIFAALRAGAVGYLLKSTAAFRLPQLLSEAASGGAPLSPSVARKIVGAFAPTEQKSPLTARELEVLERLVDGATYTDVAMAMDVQLSTVQTHVKNLYRKLQVKSRVEAEEKARRLGVLQGTLR